MAVEVPRFYRPQLDGLRFFAFLAVFFCHTSIPAAAGRSVVNQSMGLARWLVSLDRLGSLGVSLFFCLSAFLITRLLMLEEAHTGRVSVGAFYLRRILRIWPVYYLSLVLLQLWHTPFNQPMGTGTLMGFAFFAGNWVMAHLGALHNCVMILWSISVEEQFYLVWPWLFRRIHTFWILFALAWAVRMVMSFVYWDSPDPRFSSLKAMGFSCNTFFHLDTLALGALLAVYEEPLKQRFRAAYWTPVALLLWLIAARFALFPHTGPWPALLQGMVAPACLILVLKSCDLNWLAHPVLVKLGRMSYGLYVYHFFVLRMVEWHYYGQRLPGPGFWPGLGTSLLVAALGLLATIAVSWCSFEWLEKPVLKLKSKFAVVASGKTVA